MIQKVTPKKFVSDKDERLVAPNEMILAKNVTISERADGSASVLKTMKGTEGKARTASEFDALDPWASTWKVVGTVSDEQRGRIYAFVYDTADATDHRILMLSTDPDDFPSDVDTWRTVFKSSYLNFSEDYPVKGDLINKAFGQDGVVQTALYFTDNNNPPRKINIDRALNGEYKPVDQVDIDGNPTSYLNIDLDYALLTMRGAPKVIPSFSFEQDSEVTTNNFKSDVFQFSCQFIYKDGEESALSPFSELAVSPFVSSRSLTEVGSGSALEENVCLITIPWDTSSDDDRYYDVASVRLLARSGNTNPFFIIDEFDPRQNKSKDLGLASDKEIYNSETGVYRFYNDGYYVNIAESVSSKLYDNVPQKAEGQSIAASRLLYSNYTEGYPNFDIGGSSSLDVAYGSTQDFGGQFITDPDGVIKQPIIEAYTSSGNQNTATRRGEINIDLRDAIDIDWPGSNTALSDIDLPEGTKVRYQFTWNAKGSYYITTSGRYYRKFNFFSNDNTASISLEKGGNSTAPHKIDSNKYTTFTREFKTTAGQTAQDVYDELKSNWGYIARTINHSESGGTDLYVTAESNTDLNVGNILTTTGGDINWKTTFRFDALDSENSAVIRIVPYIKNISWSGAFTFGTSLASETGVANWSNSANYTQQSTYTSYNEVTQELISGSKATTYITNVSVSIKAVTEGAFSFKHGSSHEFGIVYYDKWGRSSFVNKIGSVYVKHPAERSTEADTTDKGGASVVVDISNTQDNDIPSWAESYQVVYGGSQFSNVFTYTTGGGYMVMGNTDSGYNGNSGGNPANNVIIDSDHRIYVSLNSLVQFQSNTGSPRDYSFTKGDICRVVSYAHTNGTRRWPRANDGSIIEFEVVGVEELQKSSTGYAGTDTNGVEIGGTEGNPIQWDTPTAQTRGKFLVLRAPRVDGNAQVTPTGGGTAEGLKYTGFDWFSLVKYWQNNGNAPSGAFNYPDTTTPTNANYWGNETVIEILTPKKISETPVYYEIGDRVRLGSRASTSPNGEHGPPLRLSQGDVHIRNVSCRGPVYDGGWNIHKLSAWEDATIAIENQTPGEFVDEKAWSKGRAHVAFDRAATINRYNSITYSEPYADDTNRLALSSFVPSQANFFDLPSEYGRCSFLGLSSDQLLTIQENKVSRLGINKDVLETGTQSGVVTISSKLINNLVSYAGDFGTGNPESVLIRDGITYFVDAERRAVIRLSSKGMEVISDKDISSTVEEKIAEWAEEQGKTIISGYDPEDNNYFVTLSPQGSFNGYTLGYHERGGFWQGNYSFYPDRYASIKDRFFGVKSTPYAISEERNRTIFHEFKDLANSNRFLGASTSDASKVRVVFNSNPSMVKTFKALSVEGKVDWDVRVFDENGKEALVGDSSEREGAFYRNIDGILSGSDSQFLPLGVVSSSSNQNGTLQTIVTFENSLRGMHIPKGYEVYSVSVSGNMTKLTANAANDPGETPRVFSVNRSSSKVTFRPQIDLTPNDATDSMPEEGDKLFVASPVNGLNSDRVRGKYAIVEISYSPLPLTSSDLLAGLSDFISSGQEVFAINAHFANSPLNDAIGKQ